MSKYLPEVAFMLLGTVGFVLLALNTTGWLDVPGLVVTLAIVYISYVFLKKKL